MKKVKGEILNYTVIFEPAEEGGFVVHVPALPGCHTQGETLDEAYKMAQDAILGYIETLQSLKEEIPKEAPNSIIAKVPVKI
ncbi:type II toxin-antitoxin system HicB family antitoxin [bacterium]|nr:type II toxin-antitoxin system HicB family antitoxin [bacterium]